MSDQNTPPHAKLEITVMAQNMHGIGVLDGKIQGCKECLATGIAVLLLSHPEMKELINKAVRIANERKAQKEN